MRQVLQSATGITKCDSTDHKAEKRVPASFPESGEMNSDAILTLSLPRVINVKFPLQPHH